METPELYNYLHETFQYQDGELYYKKSPNFRIVLGQKAGGTNSNGYIIIEIKQKSYKAHRLIFLYHNGYLPEFIDHIDQNKQNNNIENLREVTKSENKYNTKKYKTNTSGYKGVSYHKASKKWAACIRINKKDIWLGLFETRELAYDAYCKSAKENLTIYCLE
jgi:hypothetical protein